MYGLINQQHLKDMSHAVCDCLGHGGNHNAVELLLETAGAETKRGTYKDSTLYAGMGITQFDELPFQDVKDRCRDSDKQKLINSFDIDIDLVEWTDIRYNPLLSLIFTRLKYKKIPDVIPLTIQDRYTYYKKWYNSYEGKATLAHYINSNIEFEMA